ncbi:unnamed protein product [Camellia sinensis]
MTNSYHHEKTRAENPGVKQIIDVASPPNSGAASMVSEPNSIKQSASFDLVCPKKKKKKKKKVFKTSLFLKISGVFVKYRLRLVEFSKSSSTLTFECGVCLGFSNHNSTLISQNSIQNIIITFQNS